MLIRILMYFSNLHKIESNKQLSSMNPNPNLECVLHILVYIF